MKTISTTIHKVSSTARINHAVKRAIEQKRGLNDIQQTKSEEIKGREILGTKAKLELSRFTTEFSKIKHTQS